MLRMMFWRQRKRVTNAPDDDSSDEHLAADKDSSDDAENLLEPWGTFVSRWTHDIESRLRAHNLDDWVALYRKRKWCFAGRTARCIDGRWSARLLSWNIAPYAPGRSVGRPCAKWADGFFAEFGKDWMSDASDELLWTCGYVTFNLPKF